MTGVELTAGTPVTITASAQNYQSPPSGVTVTVVPPVFSVCNINTTRVTVSPRDDAQVCAGIQPGSAFADYRQPICRSTWQSRMQIRQA